MLTGTFKETHYMYEPCFVKNMKTRFPNGGITTGASLKQ